MDWIPPASPDVDGAPSASSSSSTTSASLSHLRLKHAREMLDSDPDQFVYAGEVREGNPPPFPPMGQEGRGGGTSVAWREWHRIHQLEKGGSNLCFIF